MGLLKVEEICLHYAKKIWFITLVFYKHIAFRRSGSVFFLLLCLRNNKSDYVYAYERKQQHVPRLLARKNVKIY